MRSSINEVIGLTDCFVENIHSETFTRQEQRGNALLLEREDRDSVKSYSNSSSCLTSCHPNCCPLRVRQHPKYPTGDDPRLCYRIPDFFVCLYQVEATRNICNLGGVCSTLFIEKSKFTE